MVNAYSNSIEESGNFPPPPPYATHVSSVGGGRGSTKQSASSSSSSSSSAQPTASSSSSYQSLQQMEAAKAPHERSIGRNITVKLLDQDIWKRFFEVNNEMIVTKSGR